MAARAIRTEGDIESLRLLLKARKLPLTVEVTEGLPRTSPQNRLQRQWCNDASQQLGDRTAEDARAYSKLHFGVPILRAESKTFCARYDEVFRPLPYETKLALMAVPFDFPVTRLMNVKQKTAYLDAMARYWASLGVVLTDPDQRKYERFNQ